MGTHGYLGEFEQIVLLALLRLGDNAYGKAIHEEIGRRSPREVAVTAVYVTLSRLEGKGYLSASLGEATPVRGGRAKKFFNIEEAGLQALRRSREQLDSFWAGIDLNVETLGSLETTPSKAARSSR